MTQQSLFQNDWTPHPGEFIKEELEARGWTQMDLAHILGRNNSYVNQILSGKVGVSSEMAKALAAAFNVSPQVFLNLQTAYSLSKGADADSGISKRAEIYSQYPLREMIKRGWIQDTDADLLETQIARFFGQSDIENVPYLAHAAKKTHYEEKEIPPTQVAWLFRVKQLAKSITVPSYSSQGLQDALGKLSKLLISPEEARHVPRILSECGVRFILVESLPQSKIDGVCLWLDDKSPVIGMSLRLDRIDNFWFVLRHEIEHVLQRHGMNEDIVDSEMEGNRSEANDDLPEEEKIANAAAASFCVPPQKMESFMKRKGPSYYEKDVLAFSKLNNIHPGLVVGQIQYKLNRYDLYRQYQVKMRQHVLPGAIVDGWGQSLLI
jgi:HTH-type transcriptional regulator/antitoxin HigA